MSVRVIDSSFRDPSGFVFHWDGIILRQVNTSYQTEYDQLMQSGLHASLVDAGLILKHEECSTPVFDRASAYKVLLPEQLLFVSHPCEWSFSQLKDAALLTLRVQRKAMEHGMSLKDASAYNVQFHQGRSVFIDTLSFERYDETKPWVAYRQFCQHFLAPLALMSCMDISLGQLLRVHLDGIPLPLASRLLPWKTRLNLGLSLHIHLHAKSQVKFAAKPDSVQNRRMTYSRRNLENLLSNLESTVSALKWQGGDTEWADYYARNNNYSAEGMQSKASLVRDFLGDVRPSTVWDLGSNTGRFSRIAAESGARTVVSWDIDPSCVEANYRQARQERDSRIHPLYLDLTNPTPAQGWAHEERASVLQRGPADCVLALGLIHHLAISNNVPLKKVAAFLARAGRTLILEWVPKEDSQVQKLLSSRRDVFPNYTQAAFEKEFSTLFSIQSARAIEGTCRHLYLMKVLPNEETSNSHSSVAVGRGADPVAVG